MNKMCENMVFPCFEFFFSFVFISLTNSHCITYINAKQTVAIHKNRT